MIKVEQDDSGGDEAAQGLYIWIWLLKFIGSYNLSTEIEVPV